MEVKVVDKEKKRIVLELGGEDNTFANVMRKTLWEDEDVESAAYRIDHPLTGEPRLMVKTKKSLPVEAVKRAAEKVGRRASEFEKKFSEASKK